jgi:hypothetical protein
VGSRWIMSPSGAGSSGSPRSWIGAADGGPMDTAPTGVPPLGLTLQRRCGWGTGFHYSLCWSRGDGSFNSTRISTLPKSMPNDLYHRQANSMRSLNWIVGANCALSSVSESGTARWCGGMRYGQCMPPCCILMPERVFLAYFFVLPRKGSMKFGEPANSDHFGR